jgi:large subunit ribosomal protein L25
VSDTLNVEKRSDTGTLRMRRLRASGRIPAVLYGHGMESVNLSADAREVSRIVSHGVHIVKLAGQLSESALIKEVQWDAIGSDVVHLDLARIDETEAVEVEITIELRGQAPGIAEGGVVRLLVHEVEIRCAANELPDHFEVKLNDLHLNQSIRAADLHLPPSAVLLVDPSLVLVTCELPQVVAEQETEAAETAEPEIIGRKEDGDEAEEKE